MANIRGNSFIRISSFYAVKSSDRGSRILVVNNNKKELMKYYNDQECYFKSNNKG